MEAFKNLTLSGDMYLSSLYMGELLPRFLVMWLQLCVWEDHKWPNWCPLLRSGHAQKENVWGLILLLFSFLFVCLFICLLSFFFCLPIRLVYSPRFGGQKRPRGRRLRYEDRWLWSRARYLQEWLVCEDDKWCIANQMDGFGIVVSEGVLREEWRVSTSNMRKVLKGYVFILKL